MKKDVNTLKVTNKIPVFSFFLQTYHTPTALGSILSFCKLWKNGILNEFFDLDHMVCSNKSQLRAQVNSSGRCIVLFSDYIWNSADHLKLSAEIKSSNPLAIVIHGGPNVPNRIGEATEFLEQNTHIDIIGRGEGELITATLLEQIIPYLKGDTPCALRKVSGISYRFQNKIFHTDPAEKIKDLTSVPSPFLDGTFSNVKDQGWRAAVIETNRGCPYGCTFCDWGINQKIRKFDIEKIKNEIDWIGENKIPIIWIADSNFGMFPRDLEIAKHIAKTKNKTGFPLQLKVNYAKNVTEILAEIVSVLVDAEMTTEGIISIQTRNEEVLDIVQRRNIKNEKYDKLLEIFVSKGLPVATDLMIGLPGSNLESLKSDIQHFFDRLSNIKVYPTQLLPNSPMSEPIYIERYKIKTDERGYIISSFSFDEKELRRMDLFVRVFDVTVMMGTLRYLLMHFQMNHGILMIDFLDRLIGSLYSDAATPLVQTKKIIRAMESNISLQNQWMLLDRRLPYLDWKGLYREVLAFANSEFQIPITEEEIFLKDLQLALIPRPWKSSTFEFEMKFDATKYFSQAKSELRNNGVKSEYFRSLSSFPRGKLTVSDPNGLCSIWFGLKYHYGIHCLHFELHSKLRFSQVKVHYWGEEVKSRWASRLKNLFLPVIHFLKKANVSDIGPLRRF